MVLNIILELVVQEGKIMKNDSEQYLKNLIAFDNYNLNVVTNVPSEYKYRQKQYLANRTAKFNANRAYLSTDYVIADVQGIDPNNFYNFIETKIRLSDIVNPSASSTKKTDDYKEILFIDPSINYIPIGAKIETMGSTWICINPRNMSSSITTSIIARCNSSFNSFDYYGNIITEPIVVEKYSMLSNDNKSPLNLMLMDGYFNITCQLNSNTQNLHQNSRIILGNKPYYITGLTDFIQEFSGDRNSCHLLQFTIRLEEPTIDDDITENFIANGNNYSFDAFINGLNNMTVGQSFTFSADFLFNGNNISSTPEYPITWIWESSNNLIATVSEDGVVSALSSGTTQIKATLSQNPQISSYIDLIINETITSPYIAFLGVNNLSIKQYNQMNINAAYFENGKETDNPLEWNLSGANETSYYYELLPNSKSINITCLTPSETPLIVKASYATYENSIEIQLNGY